MRRENCVTNGFNKAAQQRHLGVVKILRGGGGAQGRRYLQGSNGGVRGEELKGDLVLNIFNSKQRNHAVILTNTKNNFKEIHLSKYLIRSHVDLIPNSSL